MDWNCGCIDISQWNHLCCVSCIRLEGVQFSLDDIADNTKIFSIFSMWFFSQFSYGSHFKSCLWILHIIQIGINISAFRKICRISIKLTDITCLCTPYLIFSLFLSSFYFDNEDFMFWRNIDFVHRSSFLNFMCKQWRISLHIYRPHHIHITIVRYAYSYKQQKCKI